MASLRLLSNHQTGLPVSASKARTHPSPCGAMTSIRPVTSASERMPQVPCRMFAPGEASLQTSLPVVLFRQTSEGAAGATTFLCVSSTPLPDDEDQVLP